MTVGWLRAALVGSLLMAAPMALGSGASASTKVAIDVWGDSLTFQDASYLVHDFTSATELKITDFPGTSLCDWFHSIESVTKTDAPKIAVLEFIGNVSSCDGNVTAPAQLAAAYKADLKTAVSRLLAAGVAYVIIDEGPRTDCTSYAYCAAQPELHTAYKQVIAAYASSAVIYAAKADRAVETAKGKFTQTMLCLPAEVRAHKCKAGSQIQVRNSDRVHFCPVNTGSGGALGPCPVYASGAYRFAIGFAQTIWKLEPTTKPSATPRP